MKKLIIPPVFIFLGIALIVFFYFYFPEFNLIPFPYNLAGILVTFFGFSVMGRARELFRKHRTTLDFEPSSALISEGIFARSRNPMYLGMFLFLLGIAICFRCMISLLVPFAFLLLAVLFFIPKEEKLLSERFGEEYTDYKTKVRKLI